MIDKTGNKGRVYSLVACTRGQALDKEGGDVQEAIDAVDKAGVGLGVRACRAKTDYLHE